MNAFNHCYSVKLKNRFDCRKAVFLV